MTSHMPCPYVSLPVGCTDPKCLHLHPPSYRTRCRNTARPGGCQNQYCKYYHDGGGSREVWQGSQEGRKGGIQKTKRTERTEWSQQISSSQGPAGFVSGMPTRSGEVPPLYDKRDLDKDRDLWLQGQGFAGQSDGSRSGPHSEVEDERGNGRKWESSCDKKQTLANFEQQQMFERNGNEETMSNRGFGSWEKRGQDKDREFRNGGYPYTGGSRAGHITRNGLEIGEHLYEEGEQQDEYNQSWGNDRLITERGNLSLFEDPNNFFHPNSHEDAKHLKYNYSDRQQGVWTGNKEGVGRKPNIIQQNDNYSTISKKRDLSATGSDFEGETGRYFSKKLKQDIDLRLEKTNVGTFDFPENLIGLLMGKKGATISRIKDLCSPAIITVPQFCDSRGFRAIRIEGYRMQIEKAKSVIYKMFKERRIEHIVESFKGCVEDPPPTFEGNSNSMISFEDSGSRVEIEALKTKLNSMERDKYDLQKQVSKLTSDNSELLDGKYKLQGQICKLNEEVEDQRVKIKSLEMENKNSRMEKDFSVAADDSWKNISLEQNKQLNFQIETLAKELVKNNNELKARDDIINDLEQTSETRLKEIRNLQSEMERDFVQCDKCEDKFRSNELLRRHQRFKH